MITLSSRQIGWLFLIALCGLVPIFFGVAYSIHFYELFKLFSYALYSYLVCKTNSKAAQSYLPIGIFLCASWEVFSHQISLGFNQSSYWHLKGNPFYSSLLISAGFLYLIENRPKGTLKIIIWTVLLLLFIWELFILKSRAVLLGVLASIIFLSKTNTDRRTVYLLGSSGALFIAIYPGAFYSLMKLNTDSGSEIFGRLVIWLSGLSSLKDRWGLGYGLGNFETAYLQHQWPTNDVLRYAKTTQFAHNDFIQVLVESGFIGGIFVAIFLIFLLSKIRVNYKIESRLWACRVCVMFLINSCFNFSFYMPFLGLLFGGCVGLINSQFGDEKTSKMHDVRKAFACFAALLFAYVGSYAAGEYFMERGNSDMALKMAPFRGDLWYARAIRAIERGDLSDPTSRKIVLTDVANAFRLDPQNPFYRMRYALLNAHFKPEDTQRNHKLFQQALEQAPRHAPFWINYGFYCSQITEYKLAREKFIRSIQLEPLAPRPFYGLGMIALKQRKRDIAIYYFTRALELKIKYKSIENESAYAHAMFDIPVDKINAVLKERKINEF